MVGGGFAKGILRSSAQAHTFDRKFSTNWSSEAERKLEWKGHNKIIQKYLCSLWYINMQYEKYDCEILVSSYKIVFK